MGKLFGTDGIRGVVGENLTVDLAFQVGRALTTVLAEEKKHRLAIAIGKDTRISSDMLEAALGGEGRILLRPSGTEALIRVMVEAKTVELAHEVATDLADFIKKLV